MNTIYKNLITEISSHLKQKGWTKKGSTFYLLMDENWLMINFQKSSNSSANEILYTINLAISSTVLRKFNEEDTSQKPSSIKAHWQKRIGFLMPVNEDYWWKLNNNTSLPEMIGEIKEVLDKFGIPELLKYSSDSKLEQLWLTGTSDGLTDPQRLIHLTTLLKKYNKGNLDSVVEQLVELARGKSYETTARIHITELHKSQ